MRESLVRVSPQLVMISAWSVIAVVLAVALVLVVVGDILARRRSGAMLNASRRDIADERERLEQELERRRSDLETGLEDRRHTLEEDFERRRSALEESGRRRDESLERREAQVDRDRTQAADDLSRIAGLTVEQAHLELVERAEADARVEAEALSRRIEEEARTGAEERARVVLATAIQRYSADLTADSVVASVDLPSNDMKGRIIGREGRNIRCLEQVTGTTVIVDDTPGIVLVSCFDPIRREIARLTLKDLLGDGRIHPARIEQAHQRAVKRIEGLCLEAGEDALHELGIIDMAEGLRPILGSLRFRTSYGQDVLAHSIECARLAGLMAAEIGADESLCRRAALLHDLGKSLTPGIEGSHALVGAELARRYGESADVVHAIAAHHNEVEARSVVDVLTQAADAVSASRPGARRESLESHVRRLEEMESLATAHEGVARAFAVQAGRDLRVMVVPDEVDDDSARHLAREIAHEVGDRVMVPGQVKVTVIRETRAVEVTGGGD
ncbi:Ribonuclease Y [Acidipropionibacterium virtanenii]|uniref:Ribonuclease Y n=1 Tax=Acidipropionibacterium virtanenii TaxID=2057246 RepID=A0A344UUL8_9ACTN|nr:Ribonuclease Y [Acidipropionibacterium virtanenii]